MCKIREWMKSLTETTSMTKKEYILTITTSLFLGIILGFVFAPRRTKYTTIGSHNGSDNMNNGNDNTGFGELEDEEFWEEDPEEVISFK